MLVKEIMTKEVVYVTPEETLAGLTEKFIKHNYHTFPVVDVEGRVIGSVDYEDIMKVFTPHNPALEKLLKSTHFYSFEEEDILDSDLPPDLGTTVRVSDIMDTDMATIGEDSTVAKARVRMKQLNVERMAVVDSTGKLAGFITLFDIIVAVFRNKAIIE